MTVFGIFDRFDNPLFRKNTEGAMQDVRGKRIRQLRSARGMTQQQLADATGGLVTKQSISKYERGKSQPSSVVLGKLAEVFEVKTADLSREPAARIEFEAYRKFARLGKRKQEQIESIIRRKLEDRLRLQDLLGQLRDVEVPSKMWTVGSREEAEEAAEALRDEWELGRAPIADVTDVLEDHYVHVLSIDVSDDFDGVSVYAYDGDTPLAAAVVCHHGRPGERQRLNLAHELAHLVLEVEESDDFDEEDAAYRMGGAFLAPAGPLLRDVGERRRSIQFQELLILKQHYGMSVQALLYRLKDLGVISRHHYKQWFIHLGKMGWRKEEPGELPTEEPKWLRRSILRAYSEKLLSKEEAERLLGESVGDEEDAPTTLVRRRSFMELPVEERRRILARQAKDLQEHYEDGPERKKLQAGDITEYE